MSDANGLGLAPMRSVALPDRVPPGILGTISPPPPGGPWGHPLSSPPAGIPPFPPAMFAYVNGQWVSPVNGAYWYFTQQLTQQYGTVGVVYNSSGQMTYYVTTLTPPVPGLGSARQWTEVGLGAVPVAIRAGLGETPVRHYRAWYVKQPTGLGGHRFLTIGFGDMNTDLSSAQSMLAQANSELAAVGSNPSATSYVGPVNDFYTAAGDALTAATEAQTAAPNNATVQTAVSTITSYQSSIAAQQTAVSQATDATTAAAAATAAQAAATSAVTEAAAAVQAAANTQNSTPPPATPSAPSTPAPSAPQPVTPTPTPVTPAPVVAPIQTTTAATTNSAVPWIIGGALVTAAGVIGWAALAKDRKKKHKKHHTK